MCSHRCKPIHLSPDCHECPDILSSNKCLLYAIEQALRHGFNAANNVLIRVHGADLSYKTSDIWDLVRQFFKRIVVYLTPRTWINLALAAMKLCWKAGSFPYNMRFFEDKTISVALGVVKIISESNETIWTCYLYIW